MPKRYLLILSTFLLAMLLYVDRVCISAASDAIRADLTLTEREMGWVFAAFTLGYALFQTPAGMLSDRLGPRLILTLVVGAWSLFTALTAAARGLVAMVFVRFCFGAGEAGAFPGMARAVFSWLPMSERGLAQGINFSASRLGAALALPGVAWMVQQYGWKPTFVILGGVGFVWAGVWFWWFRDEPSLHTGISDAEREYIEQHRQQLADQPETPPLSAKVMFGSVNLWLLMGQYFASNFTFFFCLSWLPKHLKEHYQLSSMVEAGWYAMPVFLGGMLGNWVSGWLVDRIYSQGHWLRSRRLPAIVGFVLAAGGLLASLASSDITWAVVCLTVAVFGADMTLSPSWTTCIDIGRRHAGAVSGTMNMAGNIGSFATALAFPYLKAWTGSIVPFFVVGAVLNGLAILAWLATRPDRPLEDY